MDSKKKSKIVHSLDSPYSKPQWPIVSQDDQQTILELLCSLLSPIGQHRALHIVPSSGKRSRRQGKKQSDGNQPEQPTENASHNSAFVAQTTAPPPPPPEILSHITLGFNTTIRHLESLSQQSAPPIIKNALTNAEDKPPSAKLAVILLLGPQIPTLHAHLPLLCAMASALLVHLPNPTALQRVAATLQQPRAGLIGVFESAPHSNPLCDFVKEHVARVEVPWLNEVESGVFLPTSVRATESVGKKEHAEEAGGAENLRGPRKKRRKNQDQGQQPGTAVV